MDHRRFLITALEAGFKVQIFIGDSEKMSQHWPRSAFKNMLERTQAMLIGMNNSDSVIGTYSLYITDPDRDEPLLLDDDAAFTQAILTYS